METLKLILILVAMLFLVFCTYAGMKEKYNERNQNRNEKQK